MGSNIIENVTSYSYLGFNFILLGKKHVRIQYLIKKDKKVSIQKVSYPKTPIETESKSNRRVCKHFDSVIKPVILYQKSLIGVLLKNFIFQFLNIIITKVRPKTCNFIKKETLAQMFSFEFCRIFKNAFFTEHLQWLLLYIILQPLQKRSTLHQNINPLLPDVH